MTVAAAQVVRRFPHDPEAFTQGLLWSGDRLFESVGGFGRSAVREVELETGQVARSAALPDGMFGEGLADWGGEIISLTWRDAVALRWARDSLAPLGVQPLPGEAWGLTQDGTSLVLSDGTPALRFLDPATLAERRRIEVAAGGRPLAGLNELQWVRGELFANVIGWPAIARIDPQSGRVAGWIDLSELVREAGGGNREKPANGIAYDPAADRLLVTGKNWPWLYEIELVPLRRADAEGG